MKLVKDIKKMCTPAVVYLLLSVFALFVLIFIGKIIYIGFWTVVLDSLCKNGWGSLSWFLVFLPIILFFVILGLFMIYKNNGMNQTIVLVQEEQMI